MTRTIAIDPVTRVEGPKTLADDSSNALVRSRRIGACMRENGMAGAVLLGQHRPLRSGSRSRGVGGSRAAGRHAV